MLVSSASDQNAANSCFCCGSLITDVTVFCVRFFPDSWDHPSDLEEGRVLWASISLCLTRSYTLVLYRTSSKSRQCADPSGCMAALYVPVPTPLAGHGSFNSLVVPPLSANDPPSSTLCRVSTRERTASPGGRSRRDSRDARSESCSSSLPTLCRSDSALCRATRSDSLPILSDVLRHVGLGNYGSKTL